jgi:hypothetical protein
MEGHPYTAYADLSASTAVHASQHLVPFALQAHKHGLSIFRHIPGDGTVTLIGMCSGAVGFGAVAMDQLWVVGISGGSVERGNLTPDREAFGDLGSPSGRAEQMPSGPKMCGDATECGQEPLGMAHRFKAFHRPFTLSGGLVRVLGSIVEVLRAAVDAHARRRRLDDANRLVGRADGVIFRASASVPVTDLLVLGRCRGSGNRRTALATASSSC